MHVHTCAHTQSCGNMASTWSKTLTPRANHVSVAIMHTKLAVELKIQFVAC